MMEMGGQWLGRVAAAMRQTAYLSPGGERHAMIESKDYIYYMEREAAERRLAERAVDPAVRCVHLQMATCYRDRAARAKEAEKPKKDNANAH
jgi:hypothetical protein